jgi:hypothetical protein
VEHATRWRWLKNAAVAPSPLPMQRATQPKRGATRCTNWWHTVQ